jgi:hypothetical protein
MRLFKVDFDDGSHAYMSAADIAIKTGSSVEDIEGLYNGHEYTDLPPTAPEFNSAGYAQSSNGNLYERRIVQESAIRQEWRNVPKTVMVERWQKVMVAETIYERQLVNVAHMVLREVFEKVY